MCNSKIYIDSVGDIECKCDCCSEEKGMDSKAFENHLTEAVKNLLLDSLSIEQLLELKQIVNEHIQIEIDSRAWNP